MDDDRTKLVVGEGIWKGEEGWEGRGGKVGHPKVSLVFFQSRELTSGNWEEEEEEEEEEKGAFVSVSADVIRFFFLSFFLGQVSFFS